MIAEVSQSALEKQNNDYQKIIELHKDENLPVFPAAELVIVVPTFAELQNGNIAHLLSSLSGFRIPKEKVAVVFVVNNNQFDQVLGEMYTEEVQQPTIYEILFKLQQHFRYELSLDLRTNQLGDLLREDPSSPPFPEAQAIINRKISSYGDNQLALQVLQVIQASQQTADEKLKQLHTIWTNHFPGKPLPIGLGVAVRRKLQVAVLDCSSQGKAFRETNIGKARRDGAAMAFSHITPNAKYVHFTDADTFYNQDQLLSILQTLQQKSPDAMALSQKLTPRIMPDQLLAKKGKEFDFTNDEIVMGILQACLMSLQYSFGDYLNNTNIRLGGSQLIISRDTFNEHSYPDGKSDEDYAFSKLLRSSQAAIHFGYQPEDLLSLTYRFRNDSIDGGHFYPHFTKLTTLRRNIELREYELVDALMSKLQTIQYGEVPQEELHLYQSSVEKYRTRIQQEKRKLIKSIKQVLPDLVTLTGIDSSQISSSPAFNTIIASKPFLLDNAEYVLQFITYFKTHNLSTAEAIWDFLVTALPEFLMENTLPVTFEEHWAFLNTYHKLPSNFTVADYLPMMVGLQNVMSYRQNVLEAGGRTRQDLVRLAKAEEEMATTLDEGLDALENDDYSEKI